MQKQGTLPVATESIQRLASTKRDWMFYWKPMAYYHLYKISPSPTPAKPAQRTLLTLVYLAMLTSARLSYELA